MRTYSKAVSKRETPQSEAIPGTNQKENNAGGFSFVLDEWSHLERFLILGSAGGTYYVGERKLTQDCAKVVERCLASNPQRAVETIAKISESGRAPSNDPAIFALAVAASYRGEQTTEFIARSEALADLPRVCRTATHLFQFIANCKELRGWGRGLRNAVAKWYNDKPVEKLAYQVTKYRNRVGYTHRDALRLSHPKTTDVTRNELYRWITTGTTAAANEDPRITRIVLPFSPLALPYALDRINALDPADVSSRRDAMRLIDDYKLTLEHVPNHFLSSQGVWDTLLPHLPPTALIRNLGKMTSIDLLKPLAAQTQYVCDTLRNADRLKGARVHPLSVLLALNTYQSGHGLKGSLSWKPVPEVCAALEDAFYASFAAVEPTNKRYILGLDVSGSMDGAFIANTRLTAREAAACMAMVTMKTEPRTYPVAFSHTLTPVDLVRHTRLQDVINTLRRIPMGGTDCALPIMVATQSRIEADVFVIYTDNETWAGRMHPAQALQQYRSVMGIDAKLIVVGMTATEFTIADPNDSGMLDVVGFDAACPAIMSDFAR
jgi:60 kDa SS-A/Ro ribonucleoprotein